MIELIKYGNFICNRLTNMNIRKFLDVTDFLRKVGGTTGIL